MRVAKHVSAVRSLVFVMWLLSATAVVALMPSQVSAADCKCWAVFHCSFCHSAGGGTSNICDEKNINACFDGGQNDDCYVFDPPQIENCASCDNYDDLACQDFNGLGSTSKSKARTIISDDCD